MLSKLKFIFSIFAFGIVSWFFTIIINRVMESDLAKLFAILTSMIVGAVVLGKLWGAIDIIYSEFIGLIRY